MKKLNHLNIFRSFSEKDTINFACEFARILKGGEIILLRGPIGAGKTIFVKGLAKALCSPKIPISSSFSLMRFYPGKLNIRHYDLFRVSKREIEELEMETMDENDVIVIEWPLAAKDFYSRFDFIDIEIKLCRGNERRISVKLIGGEK